MSLIDELIRTGGSAIYFQRNYEVLREVVSESLREKGLILMRLDRALREFKWIEKFMWRALPWEEGVKPIGAFLYVPARLKVEAPLQMCFAVRGSEQIVHNMVLMEEGSSATINSACTSLGGNVLHAGYTEIYLKEGAKLSYLMLHTWNEDSRVVSKTGVVVEDEGVYTQFYTCIKSPFSLDSLSHITLGKGAAASLSTLYVAGRDSQATLSSSIELNGEGSGGEITARTVATRGARIRLPSRIVARAAGAKGHIECRGLQLASDSRIEAIPTLFSEHGGAQLTHEAAIGKVSEEELSYLMSRGFNEDEAISMLVRGFLEGGIDKVPPRLKPQVEAVLSIIARKALG